VVGRCGRKTTFRTAVVLLGFVSGVVLITTDDVHSQGLFDAFFKIFSGLPTQSNEPLSDKKIDAGGPEVAYCVRLCDGHYFPMPRNAGTPHSSPDKICSALCSASPTKVYTGSEINEASAEDGTSYSKLKNAFVYRERIISDCTCTGKDIGGTVAIDIHSDPTLRPGDIVATKDGLMVFKGTKKVPYRASDFIPAEEYKGLPAGVRRTLAELRVAPELNSADRDVTMFSAPGPESPQLSTLAPQTSPALFPRDTPVAEAFPTFAFPMF
jgi:hypothetical protein